MEPSTSNDRGGLSDAVDSPAVLLVELPRFDERDTTACLDLLTVAEPATEKLLIVSVTETIGKTHRRWDDHVGAHPDEFAVVSASFVEGDPGDGATGASPDGNAGEPTDTSWLTTHRVDDPGDLTGLGVTISSQLEEWTDADESIVVCVRSLTTTLQYVGTEELVRFLAELRKHVDRAGGVAHFHLDPEAVDGRTLAAIRSVVDAVVVGRGEETDVELLERTGRDLAALPPVALCPFDANAQRMSQGITHFAVGAAVTILVVTLAIPAVRYPRTWTIVGGGWALVPDASKLYASSAALSFHDSVWANVFWGHRLLDELDPGDSTVLASVTVAALLGATVIAEHRSYRAVEPIRTGLEEYSLLDRE